MKKKIWVGVLAYAMAFLVVGCGDTSREESIVEESVNVVGKYKGGDMTEYILTINSQDGNNVNLDLSWANMRTYNEIDTLDTTIEGNVISFTTPAHGGHGLEGNDVTITIVFDGDTATFYWGTLEDHQDTIIDMKKQ